MSRGVNNQHNTSLDPDLVMKKYPALVSGVWMSELHFCRD